MSDDLFFRIILTISLITALAIFPLLFFISAPYGRYARRGWGPQLPSWLGWLLMESVSAILMCVLFLRSDAPRTMTRVILLVMWEAHYVHRAFLYPFGLRDKWKPMPLAVPLMGAAFNLVNAYLNGTYLFDLSGSRYDVDWPGSPQFVIGVLLFVGGFIINRHADHTLHELRGQGERGYKVPYGGLYRYISCPNYFGEIVEWTGWAVATWSWPGLAFALWTFANLAPRARAHHKWYHANFKEYPAERKALIPGWW
jgi:protein-S-isoprenylcysteine O-methyltransferase Ste14